MLVRMPECGSLRARAALRRERPPAGIATVGGGVRLGTAPDGDAGLASPG
ncbi:hypothetical protein FAIPA1_70219 [Frankia sp. AiPs1]